MPALWRIAQERRAEFDARALEYDRYRPRYPGSLFDDIVQLGALRRGAATVEIGAGTGIATAPLADRGLRVTALEPAPAMAAVGAQRLRDRARFVVGRFEDWTPEEQVQLVVACNAWHWVDPGIGVQLAARLLPAGGSLALVWTEIVSWGQEPFEDLLTAMPSGRSGPRISITYRAPCAQFRWTAASTTSRCDAIDSSEHSTPRPLWP